MADLKLFDVTFSFLVLLNEHIVLGCEQFSPFSVSIELRQLMKSLGGLLANRRISEEGIGRFIGGQIFLREYTENF